MKTVEFQSRASVHVGNVDEEGTARLLARGIGDYYPNFLTNETAGEVHSSQNIIYASPSGCVLHPRRRTSRDHLECGVVTRLGLFFLFGL
jgi:hypothetical protein